MGSAIMATKVMCDHCGVIMKPSERSGFYLQIQTAAGHQSTKTYYDQCDACLFEFEKFVTSWVRPGSGMDA